MIEANKEEAQKCLGIAQGALQAGDLAKAARFADKAQRLFPTDQARSCGLRVPERRQRWAAPEQGRPKNSRSPAPAPSTHPGPCW